MTTNFGFNEIRDQRERVIRAEKRLEIEESRLAQINGLVEMGEAALAADGKERKEMIQAFLIYCTFLDAMSLSMDFVDNLSQEDKDLLSEYNL